MNDKQKAFDLENVYDEQIAPLMSKIIEICKANKLPMFATFLYMNDPQGEDGLCTTNLMFVDDRPIPGELLRLAPSITSKPMMRMQVRNADGNVVEETVIL